MVAMVAIVTVLYTAQIHVFLENLMYSNILLIIKLPHHLSEFQLERTESPSSLPAKGKVSYHAIHTNVTIDLTA